MKSIIAHYNGFHAYVCRADPEGRIVLRLRDAYGPAGMKFDVMERFVKGTTHWRVIRDAAREVLRNRRETG